MSSGVAPVEPVEAPRAYVPAEEKDVIDEKRGLDLKGSAQASDSDEAADDILVGPNGEQYPTKEELQTLRRTHGHVPMILYSIAFVELCERFAYYGTTQVCECFKHLLSPKNVRADPWQSTTISIGPCLQAPKLEKQALTDKLVRLVEAHRLRLH